MSCETCHHGSAQQISPAQNAFNVGLEALLCVRAGDPCRFIFAVLIHQNERVELDRALQAWRGESHAQTMGVAAQIESQFTQNYQGVRTLARLPGVRGIDRHAEKFTGDVRVSAQQIYSNLAQKVSILRVYIVPVDFNPE